MPMPCLMASDGEEKWTVSPLMTMVPSSGFWTPYRIFIRVDLPAPFSPTSACTVAGLTSSETSWLAMTPGNRLPMPLRLTAAGATAAFVVSVIPSPSGTLPRTVGLTRPRAR